MIKSYLKYRDGLKFNLHITCIDKNGQESIDSTTLNINAYLKLHLR